MRTVVRKLKRLVRTAAGKDFFERIDIACQTERLGSHYGGWEVVLAHIDADSVVYSFGIGDDASFDLALIERFDLLVHAFDPTPKSIEWVKAQRLPNRFIQHDVGISAFDGTASFKPPDNPDHVSYTILNRPSTQQKAITVQVRRLSTIMEELGHQHVDILKMDVEGAEYEVIDDIDASNIRPQQILIEFHHRFPNVGVAKSKRAIARIRGMGYRLFSVSSSGEEYGFMHVAR